MEELKKMGLWKVVAIIGLGFLVAASFSSDSSTQHTANKTLQVPTIETRTINTAPTQNTTYGSVNEQRIVNPGGLSNDNYYTSVDGNSVHAPAYSTDGAIPAGASAKCRDGTYSFSKHRSGTCSHHGGVATWY